MNEPYKRLSTAPIVKSLSTVIFAFTIVKFSSLRLIKKLIDNLWINVHIYIKIDYNPNFNLNF
ncbi:hypothetical protein YWY31_35410 [Paenibacillus illinoisensis]